jgi:hypothetical protein
MDRQRVLDAVDGIRSVVHEKGKYRRLMPNDLVDVEVYLQQILLEVDTVQDTWLYRLIRRTKKET